MWCGESVENWIPDAGVHEAPRARGVAEPRAGMAPGQRAGLSHHPRARLPHEPPTGIGDVAELYTACAGRLERIVRRGVRAPRPLIEDACQFAWGCLLRHQDRLHRETALSWLATTAIHEALKLVRGQARYASLETMLDEWGEGVIAGEAPDTAEIWEQRSRLELLGSLSERQQRLLWLQGLGLSYAEMADTTSQTLRTVERQLLRAKHGLRRFDAQ